MTAHPKPTTSPLLSVYSGRTCIGFILARGKLGFEAFNADQRSLGIYPTQREAAAALPDAAEVQQS
jgi:hypothetical protein